jgi:hypothetical protein
MGRPAMVRKTLRERRVEARRAGMIPRTTSFSVGLESSMIGDAGAVASSYFQCDFPGGAVLLSL